MKRQTKLNKYLAGPRVNRRHTAQLKRNVHNNAIFQEELLKQNQYSYLIKQLKQQKLLELNNDPCLGVGPNQQPLSEEEMSILDEIAAEVSPSAAAQIEEEKKLSFKDVSNEILDAEFEEVKVD
tara:strand:- start:2 stop:373 length:372 start_codon:yes stop_codon:yes gene_type:complete